MLWAVIMAGGSGTRFWPESRERKPKQFLEIFGRKTLLEETIVRLTPIIPKSRILVVTQKSQTSTVKKLLGFPSSQVVGEPVGRNTAPCAALAAALIQRKDSNAVLAVLPADHHIGQLKAFHRAVLAAAEIAQTERLPVTLGIKPEFPHTGYGYLEVENRIGREKGLAYYRLKRFHEKPSFMKAKRFYRSKKFLWNSGMFFWRADALLLATKQFLPKTSRVVHQIVGRDFDKQMNRLYAKVDSISIDYGLMEKMKGKIITLPVHLGWNDLGGWQGFADLCEKKAVPYPWKRDSAGNLQRGETLLLGSSKNIVRSGHRLIALSNVHDFVVIDSEDALLICPRNKAESVKTLVERLKAQRLKKHL